MHLNFFRSSAAVKTGPVIFALFEGEAVGLVFQDQHEGSQLGGTPDGELGELYWFDVVNRTIVVPRLGTIARWEIVT